jgi:3-oxoadipate CoA-transferase alpha subunit
MKRMINKISSSISEMISEIPDGASVMIGGFGEAGSPIELIHALIDKGSRDLTIINNNAGNGEVGLAALIGAGQVRKVICSYPRSSHSKVFPELYRAGKIELEIVPQGTLAERIRAGGAGIPAFYTPTSVGTPLADGKEVREIKGREYVLEYGLTADFALIRAEKADALGNLTYNKAARNFGPIMAMAAKTTLVQAREIVKTGEIEPEMVVTPGIFVDHVVEVNEPAIESRLIREGATYP